MKKSEKKWMILMKKLNLSLFSLLIFLLFSIVSHSSEKIILGNAKVIDGDTIKINDNKIRLFGIDAPEKKQMCEKNFLTISFLSFKKKYPCGEISTKKLKKLINKNIIKCHVEGKDRYQRKLAICFRNKLNINSWLVRNGYAVSYQKYSKKYLSEEIEAKNDKKGIWQGKFEMPWDWRKNAKK